MAPPPTTLIRPSTTLLGTSCCAGGRGARTPDQMCCCRTLGTALAGPGEPKAHQPCGTLLSAPAALPLHLQLREAPAPTLGRTLDELMPPLAGPLALISGYPTWFLSPRPAG